MLDAGAGPHSTFRARRTSAARMREVAGNSLFVAPSILLILVIIVWPIIQGLVLSFQNVYLLIPRPVAFRGLDNYAALLADPNFWPMISNTIIWAGLSVAIVVPLGLLLAVVLDINFPLRNLVRAICILPYAVPSVVVAANWKWIFDTDGGILNYLLVATGLITERIPWLASEQLALYATVLPNVWRLLPFVTLVILAGLQAVPQEIYDAAEVDGAGRWQTFRHIALPQVRYMLMICLVLSTIWSLMHLDIILVMTQGGPVRASEVMSISIYRFAFSDFQFSLSAALSTLLFLIVLGLTAIYMSLLNEKPWEEAEV